MKGRRQIPDDIKEALRLVQAGKLFALQDWIKAGKSIRPGTGGKSDSVILRAAVETGFHSMVEELLCAGGWSPTDLSHALELAREIHQPEIASLLGTHGAQPKPSDFRTSCEKLDLFMMERLLRSGVDANKDNVFAEVLSSTKARPLLRFLRQFQAEFPALQDQAALALAEAVKNRQARWVALLAWAGADPFHPVPNDLSESFPVDPENCTSAVREAAWCGTPEILRGLHLKPTPAQAVQLLGEVSYADDFKLFQTLLASVPKDLINDTARNSSTALERLVSRWPHTDFCANQQDLQGDTECLQCVERLLDLGARWNPPEQELPRIRRSLLKHEPRYTVQLLRLLLFTPNAANLGSFLEICRSQALLAKVVAVDAPLIQDIQQLRKTGRALNTFDSDAATKTEIVPAAHTLPAAGLPAASAVAAHPPPAV